MLSGTYIVVPGPAWFGPPDDCRKPSAKRTIAEDYLKLAKMAPNLTHDEVDKRLADFAEKVFKQEKDVMFTRLRLSCLQNWANRSEQSDIEYRKSIGAPSSKSVFEPLQHKP